MQIGAGLLFAGKSASQKERVFMPSKSPVSQDSVRFSATASPRPLQQLSPTERQVMETMATDYKQFLSSATCAPWTVKMIIALAEHNGFEPFPADPSKAKPGGKYYFNNDYESLALTVLGKDNPVDSGFNIVGAHTDSPQLELKPQPINVADGTARFKIKTRGGGTWLTWFNRPLGIAGRVNMPLLDKGGNPKLDPKTRLPMQTSKFVFLNKPALTIPIEAIHLNRQLNDGRKIAPEEDLQPIVSTEGYLSAEDAFESDLTEAVRQALKHKGIDPEYLDRSELYLYPLSPPTDSGLDNMEITAQGHDDRAMCYTAMRGLFDATRQTGKTPVVPDKTSIVYFFRNEETGSLNVGGARSGWPSSVAGKIARAYNPAADITELREAALDKSFIFSADVAHAIQPNFVKYHDRNNAANIGKGLTIKADTNGHYATTAKGIGITQDLAKRAGVPTQIMSTNQDVTCGTTIGPFIAANTNAMTVDVGIPVRSMHASNEVASKVDIYLAAKFFQAFFKNA